MELYMFSSLVHLMLSLSISYPYLIEFHDFADNVQQRMKHQMGVQLSPNRSKSKCENRSGFQTGCHARTWAAFTWRLSLGVRTFNPVLMMVILSGSHWLVFSKNRCRFSANGWGQPNTSFNHWFQFLDYFGIKELTVSMKPCKTLFINTL